MALCPLARWRGPVPNRTVNGIQRPLLGLILHIQEGNETGTDDWFHQDEAQASSHFGNPKNGQIDQWVDTDDKAWAEASGNPRWISIENEGYTGQSLTDNQLENAAQLLAWLHSTEGIPLQISDDPNTPGLGWHGMGGDDWGGHYDCPGDPIKTQRPQIIDRAQQILKDSSTTNPTPPPQPSPSSNTFKTEHPTLSLGASGDAVTHLQKLLGVDTIDGVFGAETQGAVKSFQSRNSLSANGTVGAATWAKLHPVLKFSSQGDAVIELQEALGIKADGDFGPATRDALLNFQRQHGLTVDGIAGFKTYLALLQ